jgi:hypothetical protein
VDEPFQLGKPDSSLFLSKKYFKFFGVIGRRKTPWTGDTTNQALVAKQKKGSQIL